MHHPFALARQMRADRRLRGVALGALVLLLVDQASKFAAVALVAPVNFGGPAPAGFLNFGVLTNPGGPAGATFGIDHLALWLSLITIPALYGLLANAAAALDDLGVLGLTGVATIIGGGLGNLHDRLATSAAIDFMMIRLPVPGPDFILVVNLADIGIAGGFLLVAAGLARSTLRARLRTQGTP